MYYILWRRIFKVDSPLRNLCCYFAARYIGHGVVFPQTLAANIIQMGAPLMLNAFNCKRQTKCSQRQKVLWTRSGYYIT